ncbi:MAG: hypothetical protein FJX74_03770 [Armatimonadetes bacterium]|nr:hypothetical protein [Armatimonadota bacterium]
MPPIHGYRCNQCDFAFPEGWGGNLYVIDDAGDRQVVCHLGESVEVERVLGPTPDARLVQDRTGFHSFCVCLDCVAQFDLDLGDETVNPWREWYARKGLYLGRWKPGCFLAPVLLGGRERMPCGTTKGRDTRTCPKCGSPHVRTCFEMIDHPCPQCKTGVVVEVDTGLVA